MNTQEALNILKQVAARFQASGQEHEVIRTAIAAIEKALAPAPKP